MSWVLIAFGVLAASVGGWQLCSRFDSYVRVKYDSPKPSFRETGVAFPPEFAGSVERLFFTVLVAADAAGYGPAMIGWLALKLGVSWTWPEFDEKSQDKSFGERHAMYHSMRKSRLVSVLTGLLSMFSALVGGLLIKAGIQSL